MLRTISLLLLLILSACGGSSGSGSTIGTIGTTSATRAVVTTTTLPPQPPALDELVISIDRMPDGWVQVDDMSGPVGLDAFDPSLIDSLSDVGIVNGYRVTFARSATSEVAALASSGAELIVSLALEMDDEEAAQSAIFDNRVVSQRDAGHLATHPHARRRYSPRVDRRDLSHGVVGRSGRPGARRKRCSGRQYREHC